MATGLIIMKIRRNSFLFVLNPSLILFISLLVGVLWSSSAQAICVKNPVTGKKVCHQDLDPGKLIPGSAQVVEKLWGEAGSTAYQAAANWMRANNGSSQSLDTLQKQYLRPHFGGLVDQVAVVYNANLMDELSAGGYRIPMNQSAAQTYCNRIYVDDPYQQGDIAQIVLLAHELTHSRQCQNYGGAGTFGFHYFREYKRAGQNYANNRLEREASAFEKQFSAWLETRSIDDQTSDRGFIINTLSGKCIDVAGAPGNTNGAGLQLWDCETSGRNPDNGSDTDQRWRLR